MTEAARLVDELTTLLYEVRTGWDDSAGGHQIVRCGACRRRADRAESVVHDNDCPVYRLIRAEASNTEVIRANAEEIADLEDRRDELEAKVNALTAEVERGQQAFADLTLASVERINALEAERGELILEVTRWIRCIELSDSHVEDLEARVAALESRFRTIKDQYGKVCAEFEFCKHVACESSVGAWFEADAALSEQGQDM